MQRRAVRSGRDVEAELHSIGERGACRLLAAGLDFAGFSVRQLRA
jgi:hypothetical protein